MPVEIRELVIRAITTPDVEEDDDDDDVDGQDQAMLSPAMTGAIVAQCVRQVMSMLKKKEER